MRKTTTKLDLLCQIEPRFVGERCPITRHMQYTWHRIDLGRPFDLNSAGSRLEYTAWYFFEYLQNEEFSSQLTDRAQIRDLNAPLSCFRDLTAFWHCVWRRYFVDNADYNIYTEDGYYGFVTQIATWEIPNRRIPRVLFPDNLRVILNETQPGFWTPFLSRAMHAIWRSSVFYRSAYADLTNVSVREAFLFDFILHWIIERDLTIILSPELKRHWSAPVSSSVPFVNRFALLLAAHSVRFGEVLRAGALSEELLLNIQMWIRDEVLPALPKARPIFFADESKAETLFDLADEKQIITTLKAAKTEPLVKKSASEIDVLVIGPLQASSGLGAGARRAVGALRHAGANIRLLSSSFRNPSFMPGSIKPGETFAGERPKAIIWHFNLETLPDVMASMPRLASCGAYNIAYPFWETEIMPRAHELACELVDEFWVPSEFCARTYKNSGVPVINVGSSVELPKFDRFFTREELGLPKGAFVVMFSFDTFSVLHRKIRRLSFAPSRKRSLEGMRTYGSCLSRRISGGGNGSIMVEAASFWSFVRQIRELHSSTRLYLFENCIR